MICLRFQVSRLHLSFYILNADNDTPIVDFEGRDSSDYQGQWVAAKDLKFGMKVLLSNGKKDIISSVKVKELETPEVTYNFEVEDAHTYYVGVEGILVHNACGTDVIDDVANQPDLGRKLDYAFGKATGSPHNIERSMSMQSQLSKIGIYDGVAGRSLLSNNLVTSYNTANNIAGAGNVAGSVIKDSLLVGPGGFLKVQSVWSNNKLITMMFFGG